MEDSNIFLCLLRKNAARQLEMLTHWCLLTHICVGNLNIIGSDNGLSPGRRQSIIWTNAVILSIGPLGKIKLQWNLNRKLNIFIQEKAFENVVCEIAAIFSRHQCVKPFYKSQGSPGPKLEPLLRSLQAKGPEYIVDMGH